MRIALDASHSLDRDPSGVGVYSARLIDALLAAAPETEFLLCYRANRYFRSLWRRRPANARRRLLEPPLIGRLAGQVHVFHGLNQRLPRVRFRRSVATFHDLFVLTGPYATAEFQRRFAGLAREAAERADHIIAVSRHTAGLVAERLGVEPSRITVAHHGVDPIPEFGAEDLAVFRRRLRLERPFLLHVGAIQARKNLRRLVEAFESLSLDLDLVLAGSDGYGAAEIHGRIAASSARWRIRALGYVDRPTLERLYRAATALAFPSLEEGFGFPALEAMSAGLPLVTSNTSALAEVAGDAALLVDPADTAAIAAALARAVSDADLQAELIRRGSARAGEFRWSRAAAETLAVYGRLA